ncbi:MAG: hypothetical protein IJF17_14160 [Thermoguttaceae bacterium]|nr:hypothetical protein [Thermoguttaceae bacterium]
MKKTKIVALIPFEIGNIMYQASRHAGDSPLLARVHTILALECGYQDARTPEERIKWLSGIGTHLSMLECEKAESDQEEVYRNDMLLAYESDLDSKEAMAILSGLRKQLEIHSRKNKRCPNLDTSKFQLSKKLG